MAGPRPRPAPEGFDLSPVAVAQATGRRAHFLGSAGLEHTNLPSGHATDRTAAVRELGRILAPGGRLLLTRSTRRGTAPTWHQQAHAAGLMVEHVDERPTEPAMWDRLYKLWITHADDLRRELGDVQTERMLREAHQVLPKLPDRRAVLLTLRRPAHALPAPGTADTMTAPRLPSGRPPFHEEVPQ
ncbi:hypothetical protein ABZW32_19390 [Streptomyces sp. NPDC004667]|uniref:hypothetical protein n=1 Tax=Streptomyces sp. NPDC004667 TaxID=3154285 RepID=UPI0033B4608E